MWKHGAHACGTRESGCTGRVEKTRAERGGCGEGSVFHILPRGFHRKMWIFTPGSRLLCTPPRFWCHAAAAARRRTAQPPRKMPLAFGQPVFSSAAFAVRLLRTPSRFVVSRCACSRRAAGPTPFGLRPFPPDRGNRPFGSGHKHPGLRPFLVCIPRSGPSALLTTAPRFWVTRTGC